VGLQITSRESPITTIPLQPRHANSGLSESDLVSGDMKEAVIYSSTTTILDIICLTTSDII